MKNADYFLYGGLLVFALKTLPIVGSVAVSVDGLLSGWGVASLAILAIGIGALMNLLE